MQKWEYEIREIGSAVLAMAANQLGEEGWELVSADHSTWSETVSKGGIPVPIVHDKWLLFFKRPKQ